MIASFRCKETRKLFRRIRPKRFPLQMQRVALRKLLMIHAATQLGDLKVPPANRLEALKGGRRGRHSIRVNDQWRVCFRWHEGNAHDVEIVDYH